MTCSSRLNSFIYRAYCIVTEIPGAHRNGRLASCDWLNWKDTYKMYPSFSYKYLDNSLIYISHLFALIWAEVQCSLMCSCNETCWTPSCSCNETCVTSFCSWGIEHFNCLIVICLFIRVFIYLFEFWRLYSALTYKIKFYLTIKNSQVKFLSFSLLNRNYYQLVEFSVMKKNNFLCHSPNRLNGLKIVK